MSAQVHSGPACPHRAGLRCRGTRSVLRRAYCDIGTAPGGGERDGGSSSSVLWAGGARGLCAREGGRHGRKRRHVGREHGILEVQRHLADHTAPESLAEARARGHGPRLTLAPCPRHARAPEVVRGGFRRGGVRAVVSCRAVVHAIVRCEVLRCYEACTSCTQVSTSCTYRSARVLRARGTAAAGRGARGAGAAEG